MSETQRFAVAVVALTLLSTLLVWWLERSSVERLARDFRDYLGKHDAFREQYPEGTSGD